MDMMVHAASRGRWGIVSECLLNPAKYYDTDEDGWTLLMHAAAQNKEEWVQRLLSNSAQSDINNLWQTALVLACKKGHTRIVRVLLDDGTSDVTIEDAGGYTAMDYAQHYGDDEMVWLIDGVINPVARLFTAINMLM